DGPKMEKLPTPSKHRANFGFDERVGFNHQEPKVRDIFVAARMRAWFERTRANERTGRVRLFEPVRYTPEMAATILFSFFAGVVATRILRVADPQRIILAIQVEEQSPIFRRIVKKADRACFKKL